ncbi:uncharacterized protein PG986_006116 [Apiospora aurea]|uniref:Uncharacterized protein n=1 Tax=Apiospora aurea TaxID=335848 RepID=A0ABR1QJX6_9PEZI
MNPLGSLDQVSRPLQVFHLKPYPQSPALSILPDWVQITCSCLGVPPLSGMEQHYLYQDPEKALFWTPAYLSCSPVEDHRSPTKALCPAWRPCCSGAARFKSGVPNLEFASLVADAYVPRAGGDLLSPLAHE